MGVDLRTGSGLDRAFRGADFSARSPSGNNRAQTTGNSADAVNVTG
jgi:hypothetical protein